MNTTAPLLVDDPKRYRPEPGDVIVRVRELRREHRGRIFEARNVRTGEGIRGPLLDVTIYALDNTAIVRFKGVEPGLLADYDDGLLLLKPVDYPAPAATA